jgi:aromatic-L-amino-acid decarboxylase
MVLRWYGVRGVRDHVARHLRLAALLAGWIDAHPDFERLAPVPLSVVCFRWNPASRAVSEDELDRANERLMHDVNASGRAFLSHTRINARLALRIAIGHMGTGEEHLRRTWTLLTELVRR